MPVLVEAMERHGHLRLGPEIRAAVLAMSASPIDRSLREVREQAGGRKPPSDGCAIVGPQEHSGAQRSRTGTTRRRGSSRPTSSRIAAPVANGSFVQTLTVTDIATGWTECAPLLYREQTLLRRCWARSAGGCRSNTWFRHGQRQRFRERDGARLLPGFRDCFHPLPSVAQRTTRPLSSRRMARSSAASSATAASRVWKPRRRYRGSTRRRDCS